ncbi:MAG: cell division protein FtsZ [Candidatus Ratteibacteria bacterium]|nr:cell division protein FtsZ [Candidatus Ratteibacteria bacterium]
MFKIDNKINGKSALNIKVFGVGGAGGNIVNLAVKDSFPGIEFISVNTDSQALKASLAPIKIELGTYTTKGEGTGGNLDAARRACEEQREEIVQMLKGTHLVFIVAGMGGGTGTGASPVISEIAHGLGIMTIAIVALPFSFEGKRKKMKALRGKEDLKRTADALIAIENDKLFTGFTGTLSLTESFEKANRVFAELIESLSSHLINPGIVNMDMAAFRKVIEGGREVILAIGEGEGANRVLSAVDSAVNSPWVEKNSFKKLKRVLISVMGGEDLNFREASQVVEMINHRVNSEAYITFGAFSLPKYNNKLKVIVVGDTTMVESIQDFKEPSMVSPTKKSEGGPFLWKE